MKLLKRITSFVLVVEITAFVPFTGGVKEDEIVLYRRKENM